MPQDPRHFLEAPLFLEKFKANRKIKRIFVGLVHLEGIFILR
jgi:hypothetical protein